MPSAPLFYPPLLRAAALSAKIGEAGMPAADLVDSRLSYMAVPGEGGKTDFVHMNEFSKGIKENPATGEPMLQSLSAIHQLMAAKSGTNGQGITFNLTGDNDTYVASRVATWLNNHPEAMDQADFDKAAQIGEELVRAATGELERHPVSLQGSTMDIGPQAATLLFKSWEGKAPLTGEEGAKLSYLMGREIEKAATPRPADDDAHPFKWIEDGSTELLALWPGNFGKMATSLGVKVDEKAVDEAGAKLREAMLNAGPYAAAAQATMRVIELTGGSVTDPAAREGAAKLLQGNVLDAVPGKVGELAAAHHELGADAAPWIGVRLLETQGIAGNVDGLAAQLREKQRQLKEPPPADDPATTPPTDPGKPADPGTTPTDPGGTPTDPGKPTDPGGTPTDPGKPTDPGTTPTDPSKPADPGKPTDPSTTPTDPGKPADPGGTPTQPSDPGKPVDPGTTPTDPSKPADPGTKPEEPGEKPVDPQPDPQTPQQV